MVTSPPKVTSCTVAGVPTASAPITRSAPPPVSVTSWLNTTLPLALTMRRSPDMATDWTNNTDAAVVTVIPLSKSVVPASPSVWPAATLPLKLRLPPADRVSVSATVVVAGSPPTKFFCPDARSAVGVPITILPTAVMARAPLILAESLSV